MSKLTDKIDYNLAGLEAISTGICSGCDQCQRDYDLDEQRLEDALDDGTICNEPSCSRQPCDACGSSLAGDRHDAHAIDPGPFENTYQTAPRIIHLNVCSDCVEYLANGTEPEENP